ncbi:hypothetical protein [Cystobacter fuscus]|uniref:hypothetical protein n=1 Tax=Cystobacter fuscus TaxID=43 RepID=UPI0037BF3D23
MAAGPEELGQSVTPLHQAVPGMRIDGDYIVKRVEYVEEDQFVTSTATQSGATWGIDRIDQTSSTL